MATNGASNGTGRRSFLKGIALAGGLAAPAAEAQTSQTPAAQPAAVTHYPRVYTGRQLAQIAFPLGGVGCGTISLGGRGQLRDWEIYNRPDKGRSPGYAFASIWAKVGNRKPVAHVLEARLAPPYATGRGLGPANAPGLTRLQSATFTGEYPFARVAFQEPKLPLEIGLEAFSPIIPLDPEESGLPVAILRYRVRNRGAQKAAVSIAFSLENPVGMALGRRPEQGRSCEYRTGADLAGFVMRNPSMGAADPLNGSFSLAVVKPGNGRLTYLRGWPNAKWWTSPLLFWDDFSQDGELGPEAESRNAVGSLCLGRELDAGAAADYTFLLSWRFPNRTAAWSGWTAPKGRENENLGNHYAMRFQDSWEAAAYAAGKLQELESRTREFARVIRESTLPAPVLDAAMSNLSTLATQTSFRTADGEFHGFEGCDDQRGCCFGNCTHVWNYETTTHAVFPSLARSLRQSAFGYSQDEQGGMRFRQMLPDGYARFGYAAADGQMGQVIKAYLDWKLDGDGEWLRGLWPKIRKAIAFAWIKGGWDANRDGVMEGVQHNTYDVEFYGPNPLCGIYYLGALRAAEEMARALGDGAAAAEYRELFDRGSKAIDRELFNGEYYIQKVRGIPKSEIAPSTVGDMGAENTEKPEFQVGDGCLADQLIGQYLADVAGLGPLLNPAHIRSALASIHKYNSRASLYEHDSVQRIYALNDEPAVLICDYGRGTRPQSPFPYYAEAWTGIEYLLGAQLIFAGMVREGIACFENVRRRFDGERRNPWDEPECGHHYARAMSAWSGVLALSGFRYHAAEKSVEAAPRLGVRPFTSFWSAGSGWGKFTLADVNGRTRFTLAVVEGTLRVRKLTVAGKPASLAGEVLVKPGAELVASV